MAACGVPGLELDFSSSFLSSASVNGRMGGCFFVGLGGSECKTVEMDDVIMSPEGRCKGKGISNVRC